MMANARTCTICGLAENGCAQIPGHHFTPAARTITDEEAMTRLHAALTGVEWDASMWDVVSDVIIATGRVIASPDEEAKPIGADLLAEMEEEYPVDGGDALVYDESKPFLLVEENVHGGYFLTAHASLDDAADYHTGQEYAEEWSIVYAVDLRDGSAHRETGRTTNLTWEADK